MLPVTSWPEGSEEDGTDGDRPRVLLACALDATPSIIADMLRAAGFAVAVCNGPTAKQRCSLVERGGCTLVDGADVVVDFLGVGEPEHRDLVEALRETDPPVPVVAEITRPKADENRDLLAGCRLIYAPVTSAMLIEQIWAALEEPAGPTRPEPLTNHG